MRAGWTLSLVALLGCEAPTEGLGTLGPPPGAVCRGALRGKAVGVLSSPRGELYQPDAGHPALGVDGLYFADNGPNGGVLSLWKRSNVVTPLNEATPTWRMSVLGSDGRSVLWAQTGWEGNSASMIMRAGAGGLSERLGVTEAPVNPIGENVPAPRPLDGAMAAYLTTATVEATGREQNQTFANLLALSPTEPPYFRWPHLALTGNTGLNDQKIIVYDLSDSWRSAERGPGAYRNTLLMGPSILWLEGDVPFVASVDEPQRGEPIGDLHCSSMDTDGVRAILACDPEATSFGSPWLSRNRSLYLYEGGLLFPIDIGGHTATLPRIRGDTIAFLAYEPTDFCANRGPGRAVVYDLVARSSIELGQITHGCYCCDSFWPLPELLLEDELVAWSYDVTDPAKVGWGMAELSRACPK